MEYIKEGRGQERATSQGFQGKSKRDSEVAKIGFYNFRD